MSIFNKLTATFQASKQLLKQALEEYIIFSAATKQLTLRKKAVLVLCQQAESRVEQLKSLKPDIDEGLIATIEYNQMQVEVHFTPEKITLHKDYIEGELRLLKKPQFDTESIAYRYLIAGWQIFLGGTIPNGVLPKGMRIENDKVYYNIPRNQSQLLDVLFHNLENDSVLMTKLQQGDLTIQSSVAVNWNDFPLQKLFQLFNVKSM
ncbi:MULTISPECIES: hypothetical protein [Calothrix]|uniref:Uncharacterized protein n=2 Tax=Calothrix TaxID=1186 RepID=A0ABR8AA69_9CYAN|nr:MULTISPECIES: hypothetical protein [Calothrix]MBD2196847.1 hypothetical protein [Calothrix parietina FACHB-288]MBD2225483.1 hypothetical protein [Calothrix anomala FACHB-343]